MRSSLIKSEKFTFTIFVAKQKITEMKGVKELKSSLMKSEKRTVMHM